MAVEQEIKRTTGAIKNVVNPFEIPNVVLEVDTPNGKSIKVEATAADCVLDVRQFLLDIPDTCDLTSYHLEHEGEVFNDFFELAEYPKLFRENAVNRIKIAPDPYDERASRTHIRRLREIMTKPPSGGAGTKFVSPYVQQEMDKTKKSKGKKGSRKVKENEVVLAPSLTDFHVQKKKSKIPQCLKNIRFSAWNSPPGNRRLRGDLVYLEINTFEDNMLSVTSAVDGFFLNQSTSDKFDPNPASPSYHSQTLTGLLKLASPTFASRYGVLITSQASVHPFESLDIPQSLTSWTTPLAEHTYDWNRAEDALLCNYGTQAGITRDWNEEYQSCKELPKDSPQDRILRDRTMYRVYYEFVEAATKGACAVVRGDIPPINPVDPKRSHVFIHNNIFFSLAIDGRNFYSLLGGDKVAHAIAKHDLKGIQQIEMMEIPSLHTLATVVVDYCGQRVVCQSIIPGIFHGDRLSRHVYGSMDQGENLQSKEDFHDMMKQSATHLRLKEHKVADEAGNEVALYTCIDSKGIIGSDGRNYLLDLIRMTPRDANYPDPTKHMQCILRPELVTAYCRTKEYQGLMEFVIAEKAKEAEEAEAAKAAKAAEEANGENGNGESAESSGAEADAEEKEEKEDDKTVAKAVAESERVRALTEAKQKAHLETISAGLVFNTDVFTGTKLADSAEQIALDEEKVREMSTWLKEQQIPAMVKGMVAMQTAPIDGQTLSDCFHEKGVNMRYLGAVAKLLEKQEAKYLAELCVQDMIVRVAKRELARGMQRVNPTNSKHERFLGPFVARFLSAALGEHCGGKGLTDDQLECARTICASARKAEQELSEVQCKEEQRQFEERQEKEKQRDTGFQMPAVIQEDENESGNNSKKSRKARKKKGNATAEPLTIKLQDGKRAPDDMVAPANLWESIRQAVHEKFDYELPARVEFSDGQKMAILRNLCTVAGIQIQSRSYNWTHSVPFSTDDVLDLFAVVKSYAPVSKDAQHALQAGKYHLKKGNVYMAYKFLQEASGFHNQVYGPMHPESAECFSYLAQALFQAEDNAHAVENQERAVIVMERIFGLDHSKTACAHSSLALYLHVNGESEKALGHVRRAAYLYDLMNMGHPDAASSHTNLSMLLQEAGQAKASMLHLKTALQRTIQTFGKTDIQVGRAHHAMAQAAGHQGFYRQAIVHEKQAKIIFDRTFGAESRAVVQAKALLQQYTAQAVKAEQAGRKGEVRGPKRTGWMVLHSCAWAPRVSVNDIRQQQYQQQVLIDTLAARQQAKQQQLAGAAGADGANNKALTVEPEAGSTAAVADKQEAAEAPAPAAVSKSKKRRNKKKGKKQAGTNGVAQK